MEISQLPENLEKIPELQSLAGKILRTKKKNLMLSSGDVSIEFFGCDIKDDHSFRLSQGDLNVPQLWKNFLTTASTEVNRESS